MTRLEKSDAPELALFAIHFGEDEADDTVDSDQALESAVARIMSEGGTPALDRLVAQMAWAKVAGPADGTQLSLWLRMTSPLPGGKDIRAWLDYASRYVGTFRRSGVPPIAPRDDPPMPIRSREGRFHDLNAGNLAVTRVLGAHEGQFRAWSADRAGSWRLHLYAEVGREVGWSVPCRDTRMADWPTAQKTTAAAAVVVMKIDVKTGRPFVATAYPEVQLSIEARERYPDLPHFFGGYFSQDYSELDANLWGAEANFSACVARPVRQRVADQLALLLTEDDESLRRSVDALGSYALPVDLRRWVTGLRRRMVWMDWQGDGPLEPPDRDLRVG